MSSQNRDNFLGQKSSTRVKQAPGGKSSFSLGWNNESSQPKKAKQSSQGESNVNQSFNFKPSHLQSNSEAVLQFTVETGSKCAIRPEKMNSDEVKFITKMIIDELLELLATDMNPMKAKMLMTELVQNAKEVPQIDPKDEKNLIAEQADAFVDIWYYSLNAACKKGMNLSKIFSIVHQANMAKKDPATGQFKRRSDGKILKPQGWRAPDVKAEIERQYENGSWD